MGVNDPLPIAETVLLAAVCGLFCGTARDCETDIDLELDPLAASAQEVVVGTIGFAGADARGAITVTATVAAWRLLTPLAMGVSVSEATLCDSVGELANMLAGRFRNALLRLGIEILVATPIATRGTRLAVHANEGASIRWHDFAFAGAEFRLRFDVSFTDGFDFSGRESAAVDPNEQDLVLF
jgi:CheY-specific phosphatase CheX